MKTYPYWLEEPLLTGSYDRLPPRGEICIIGSGLSGVSTAYWLGKLGLQSLVLIDASPEEAASVRNAGHILYGPVESMVRLSALHGEQKAKDIWQYSIDACHAVRDTVRELNLSIDYAQDGYLVIGVDDQENEEILSSIKILNESGFQSDYVSKKQLEEMGFKNIYGGRFEKGSAQAHPVKFRNSLIRHCNDRFGLKYFSGKQVVDLQENSRGVDVVTSTESASFDAVVIAANAYSPLFSEFFSSRGLVEPFRGQIQVSRPLTVKIPVSYPHSFDHGFEYALALAENRLLIGGWRHAVSGQEKGLYDLSTNPEIFQGLAQFVEDHYLWNEKVEWEYSWSGIMAASRTGFPFIGPTAHPQIYCIAGFTGHGFSWAHGSAKLLADIIMGKPQPKIARLFNPVIS